MSNPKKPTVAFIDSDVILFKSASAGEQVVYTYHDTDGKEVARFTSAEAGKKWLEEVEVFGVDFEFGYEGDVKDLTRQQHFEDKGFDKCKEAWENSVKYLEEDLLKFNDELEFHYYISSASGLKNFRYDVATIACYKGNRDDTRKPKYLEELRSWCISKENVKAPRIKFEIDDMVNALAKKYGEDGLVVSYDKDVQGVSGAWFYMPDDYDTPVYSSEKIVGELELLPSNKVKGHGVIFWLWQCMASDTADNIKGCKGVGKKKAYDILKDYSGKPIEELPNLLTVVAKVFKKEYGDSYTYTHCYTKEKVTVSWYEVFRENLGLVMMLANQDDSVDKSILKYLKKEDVDNDSSGEGS